ncbi:hypothetical protein RFN58_07000 [Streptomyces iakyrus]|uniref:hypothetical protein n=1 Tax=Streptomyces iakyrus TaxID=68219 RepID=UPI0005243258|nr:hypothetical protein [Streptomyces iakyrus]
MSVCATCRQPGITVYAEHRCPGRRPLAVGDIIHGSAHGAFGRDHHDCVRIEAVGPDWIVARNPDEKWRDPAFASGRRSLLLCQQARDEHDHDGEPCPFEDDGPPLTTWQLGPA